MSGGASSKRKGSAFERQVCAALSMWISKGQHDDWLWRSAMSGGRGTRREVKRGAQKVSGDICAVAPGGHLLCDYWHIEAKHVKNMQFTSFALKGTGFLATEWKRCRRQAESHGKKAMMIVRQNLMPDIVFLNEEPFHTPQIYILYRPELLCLVFLLSDLLAVPYSMPRLKMPADVPAAPLSPEETAALERAQAYAAKRKKGE